MVSEQRNVASGSGRMPMDSGGARTNRGGAADIEPMFGPEFAARFNVIKVGG